MVGRVLAICTALSAVACYDPRLEDCKLRCGEGDSCPRDMTCATTTGLCIRKGSTTDCTMIDAQNTPVDASPPLDDASTEPDAAIEPDASEIAILRLEVVGPSGRIVTPNNLSNCNVADSPCAYSLMREDEVVLEARPRAQFDHWEGACGGTDAMDCTATMSADVVTVRAVFFSEQQ